MKIFGERRTLVHPPKVNESTNQVINPTAIRDQHTLSSHIRNISGYFRISASMYCRNGITRSTCTTIGDYRGKSRSNNIYNTSTSVLASCLCRPVALSLNITNCTALFLFSYRYHPSTGCGFPYSVLFIMNLANNPPYQYRYLQPNSPVYSISA